MGFDTKPGLLPKREKRLAMRDVEGPDVQGPIENL
jgi:hypothetical protein